MAFAPRTHLLAAASLLAFAGSAQAAARPSDPPATPASAPTPEPQASSTASDEIVVTAQKREQRLIDVPQSVSVVTGQELEQAHAQRFADYFTRVPSASFSESQAGETRLVLRGINAGGVGATVATYVDETPYGSATSIANGAILTPDLDPFDVERVEVLRGPQGTLYGSNSLGGLVKYVTVAPQTDAFHFAGEAGVETVDHGNTGWNARAAVNLPLGDTMAIRGSGYYRKDPGFIDDPRFGRDVNDGETYGGRVSLLVKPFTGLTLRGTAVLQDLHSNDSNGVDMDPATLTPVAGLSHSRTIHEPNDIKYRIYNLTADYDLGPMALVSSTSWGKLDQHDTQDLTAAYEPLLTGAFGTPVGADIGQHMAQNRFTQEVRLASTGKHFLDWTIGGFYTRERNNNDQNLDALDPASGAVLGAFSPLELATEHSTYREVAGFANAIFHFAPMSDLTLGGRYSYNEQSDRATTDGPLAGGFTEFLGNSHDTVFTYSVAPAFKPNEHLTIYARVARGYQPGGPNALPPGAAGVGLTHHFEPDTTTNYEIGIKADPSRALSFELTGFIVDWNDVQLLQSVAGYGIVGNGNKARSKGVELAVTARPVHGLTLAANGAYIDAHLTQDAPAVGGVAGDPLPYSPLLSGTISADYDRPLGDKLDGSFGVAWRYTGVRHSDWGSGLYRLSPYGQLDAHLGVTVSGFRIDAFARNLTDSRGIVYVGTPGFAPGGNVTAAIVRPRSFGLSVGYRY